MNAVRHFADLAAVALPDRPVQLAIGMFDGVHLGHQAVIAGAVEAAQRDGGVAGVLTFWPHPSAVLRPDQPVRLIQDQAAKHRVLDRLGVDFVVEHPFTPDFARTPAEDFLPWLRAGLPRLAGLHVGENWRFGRGRAGDGRSLAAAGATAGVTVTVTPSLQQDGAPISSSRIRTLLEAGEIAAANALLGYPYFSLGTVRPGRQLGRQLGFPTLNLPWTRDLCPRFGVYAVSVIDAAGATSLGVANFGRRPTVEAAAAPLLEVHVLGDSALGPGDALTVHWLQFLRPEQRFAGLDELRAQIARDRQHALAYFAAVARGENPQTTA